MNNRGFTLAEIILTILIGSLLMLVLTNLFVGGMRVTQVGSSHLTNLHAADILFQRVSLDLSLATKLDATLDDLSKGKFSLTTAVVPNGGVEPGMKRISYSPGISGQGWKRQEGDAAAHVFSSDLYVKLSVIKVEVPPQGRQGCFVEVTVSSPPKGTEKHTLKRFVYLGNLPENQQKISKWQALE